MAQKWEYELANKFGIKPYIRRVGGVEERYPDVKAIKSFDDFCRCVFDCLAEEKFVELYEHKFVHKYKAEPGSTDTLDKLIRSFITADIKEAVEMINRGLEANEIEGIEVVDEIAETATNSADKPLTPQIMKKVELIPD